MQCNVIFKKYGVNHSWSHMHQHKYFIVDYSVLRPLNNIQFLVLRKYSHHIPVVVTQGLESKVITYFLLPYV